MSIKIKEILLENFGDNEISNYKKAEKDLLLKNLVILFLTKEQNKTEFIDFDDIKILVNPKSFLGLNIFNLIFVEKGYNLDEELKESLKNKVLSRRFKNIEYREFEFNENYKKEKRTCIIKITQKSKNIIKEDGRLIPDNEFCLRISEDLIDEFEKAITIGLKEINKEKFVDLDVKFEYERID